MIVGAVYQLKIVCVSRTQGYNAAHSALNIIEALLNDPTTNAVCQLGAMYNGYSGNPSISTVVTG